MYSNGIQMYRKTNVVTADPKRLVLMCYEGAIDSLKIGIQKLAGKDYEEKGKNIAKARDIISELKSSLNFEQGGTIAANLDSLYNYMLKRITEADLENDVQAFEDVIGMLGDLKSAWEEIFYKQKNAIGSEVAAPQDAVDGEIVSYSGV
jgi:flagellar protein FliS